MNYLTYFKALAFATPLVPVLMYFLSVKAFKGDSS